MATIDQAVSVNQADEILLQPGAEYECIIYNRDTGEQKKEMGRIPSEFVGCKREDIEKYYNPETIQAQITEEFLLRKKTVSMFLYMKVDPAVNLLDWIKENNIIYGKFRFYFKLI